MRLSRPLFALLLLCSLASLLFYLMARGIPPGDAKALLIQAFVGEAIESIANDGLRELAISAAQRSSTESRAAWLFRTRWEPIVKKLATQH